MIATYVINLPERKDKRKHIEEQFKDITVVKPKLFPAIKHKNGSMGCLMSHQVIVGMAKQMKYDMVLVIEDDCVLCPDFNKRWPKVYNWLKDKDHKDQWEIFNGGMTCVRNNSVSLVDMSIPIIHAQGLRTQFIVYNSSCYDKILNIPLNRVIDQILRDDSHMLTTLPFLSVQMATKSDIQHRHRDNVKNFYDTEKKIATVLKEKLKLHDIKK